MRLHVLAGLLLGLGHLVWLAIGGPGSWWIAIPFFTLETWGLTQFTLRAMLAWDATPSPAVRTPNVDLPVDIVVTCTFHTPEELERTLVSCRSVRGARRTVVTLQNERPELVAVLDSFEVETVIADGNHVDGFWAGARNSSFALWLEAGQVPMPGCIDALAPEFAEPSVAFVQARLGMLNTDSFAHLRGGRDEDAFRSEVVQPRLGQRGAASWRGGGSMVRVLAVASSGGFDRGDQAALQRSMIRLQAAGWTSRFCDAPEVVHSAAPDSLGSYLMVRRRSGIELLRVFRTAENPLRHPGLTRRQRLEHVALASGFASSIRQLAATVLLTLILLTGAVPYAGTGVIWAALWLSAQVMMVKANRLLARGTMERGDWTRQAWRTLAADLNAFATVLGAQRRLVAFYATSGSGFSALGKLRLPTATLLVLDLAVIARGLTLVWPRLLPRFSLSGRLVALGLGVMVIIVLVDVLQMAVRRKQRRTTFRLTTDLPATIGGHFVQVVDLAVKGLGSHLFSASSTFELGQVVPISLRVPDGNGHEQTLRMEGTVRSLVNRGDHQRIGVQFGELTAGVRTGLISYCAVGHHEAAVDDTTHTVDPARFEVPEHRGRLTKVMSACAMLVGIAVLFGGPAAPAALADVLTSTSVCLQSSTGQPVAGASAGFQYDETWHPIGMTGDDGCVVGQMPETKTKIELVHQGIRQVTRQNLAHDPVVQFALTPVHVVLTDSSGEGVPGGAVQFRSEGTWKPLGITSDGGTLNTELLGSRRPFSITLDGVRVERTIDLREVSTVAFATSPFSVSLHDSSGAPIPGAAVDYRGDDWIPLGTTTEDGTFRGEMLPGRVRFAVRSNGGRTTLRQSLSDDATVRFQTQPVTVEFTDSFGGPLAGAPVEIEGDTWVEVGATDANGQFTTELLPQTRSFRIRHEGRRTRVRQDITNDPIVRFQTVLATVYMTASDGSPLPGVPVEMQGDGWAPLGTTDGAGQLKAELLPVSTRFRVSLDGRRHQVRQDLAHERDVAVATIEAVVRLVDSVGNPISGSQVDVKAARWELSGTTNEAGEVRLEVLPTTVSFRVLHEGLRKVVRVDTASMPVVEMQTVPLVADELDAVTQYKAGSWRPFSDGVEVLPVRLQVRMADGNRRTVNLVANAVNHVPSGQTEPLPDTAGPSESEDDESGPTDSAPAQTSTTTVVAGPDAVAPTTTDAEPEDRGLAIDQSTTTSTADVTTTQAQSSTSSPPPNGVETETTTTQVLTTTTAADASTIVSTTAEPTGQSEATTTTAPAGEAVETTTSIDRPTTTAEPVATTSTISASSSSSLAPATTTTVAATTSTSTTAEIATTIDASEETTTTAAITELDESADSGEEIVQAVAGATILAAPGEVFESEAMATGFSWTSPDAVANEVLGITLEEASVYSEVGTAATVGYSFLVDNLSDDDLESGSVVELHIPGALELTPESQEEWSCEADGATWRCAHIGPLLADSSSTIQVAAAIQQRDVLTVASGSRQPDFGIAAAAALLMLGTLYAGMAFAGRVRND